MILLRGSALLWICLCSSVASVAAQRSLSVQVTLEAQEVELGRPFVMHLAAKHQKGSTVQWPAPWPLGPEFEELSRRVEQRAAGEQLVISEAHITLMAFDTAVRALPAVELQIVDATGSSQRIKTQRVSLHVTGLLNPEELKLRPLAQPVAAMVRDTRLLIFIGSVLAVFTLTALLWWLVRRRKSAQSLKPVRMKARLPPHEEALAKLDALEASGALDASRLKAAYLDMSEIFRDYLGRRFGFSSLDLTTSEIRSRLMSVEGSHQWHKTVVTWLSRCDLVKYANSAADPDEAREALYSVRVLIERTKEVAQDRPQEVARA